MVPQCYSNENSIKSTLLDINLNVCEFWPAAAFKVKVFLRVTSICLHGEKPQCAYGEYTQMTHLDIWFGCRDFTRFKLWHVELKHTHEHARNHIPTHTTATQEENTNSNTSSIYFLFKHPVIKDQRWNRPSVSSCTSIRISEKGVSYM